MSNPSFPGSGERRLEEVQKDVAQARLPARAHSGSGPGPLPLVVTPSGSPANVELLKNFQVIPKTLSRPIAPAIADQRSGTIPKPTISHTIAPVQSIGIKKDVQTAPLTLTTTTTAAAAMSVQVPSGGTAVPNVVQISAPTSSTSISTLHVPNVSSVMRVSQAQMAGHHPTNFPSHLPRGAVVAASALSVKPGSSSAVINVPRPHGPTPAAIPMPVSSAHTGPVVGMHGTIRGSLLPQAMRPGTPPASRTPPVSAGAQVAEAQRPSISLNSTTTGAAGSSIQITLQASSRTNVEVPSKPVTTFQPSKVHINQGLNMTSQPKVVMSQNVTPIIQQHALSTVKSSKVSSAAAAAGTSVSTVTVSLASTAVTIPVYTTGTTTIPIAKVTPQRQQHTAQPLALQNPVPQPIGPTQHRTEPTSYPQPQPAHAHSQPQTHVAGHGQTQQPAHSNPVSSAFVPQAARASPNVTSAISMAGTIGQTDARDGLPPVPFFPPYMLSPENPYYQQLMRYQVAAVAQAQAIQSRPPGLLQQQQTGSPNVAAVLQAAAQLNPSSAQQNVRFSHPMMVTVQEQLRHQPPQSVHAQYHMASASEGSTAVSAAAEPISIPSLAMSMSGSSVAAVAAVASSLYTAGSLQQPLPQQAPLTPSSASANNPSASPRPSILRKRTNEGISSVKKQLILGPTDTVSPRSENRPDSTPQSNTSSPKTPASGESQSSTDTALSSDLATTPTLHSLGDIKVKQEPVDGQENGYPMSSSTEASPRKKPRKQLLHATEELKDGNSTDEDFDDEKLGIKAEVPTVEEFKREIRDEYVDEEGVRWTLEKKRPPVSLLNCYNISWKPKNNHFLRYTDVKPKEERRPTVNELSNQRGVAQKASGWKLYHMAAQIEDLIELEKDLCTKITQLQSVVAPAAPVKHSVLENDTDMLHELTQGNIQRCQLITDQLGEGKSSMLKVLEHKQRIYEIINKHMSKRPIKKKERS